jgi:hypothetical protein
MNEPVPSILLSHLPREISREALAVLPILRYEGDVVLVENHRALVL